MQAQLTELYTGCGYAGCTTAPTNIVMAADANWADALARLLAEEVQNVWKQKAMPKNLNQRLTAAYAGIFIEAIQEGYGVTLQDVDYDTPDWDMLRNLTQNAYQFAAAKNYTQLRQLTQALIGPDGKLRTYNQFKQAAFDITNEHVTNWLQAEYNTAIGSAQMARKWVDIQRNKGSMPLLQFDAVIDSQTSDTCRPLDGVIKPADDPFWDFYYPPNHFNCRSTVRQLATGRITSDADIVHPQRGIPPMFKTNLAKTGVLWPNEHPYWVGLPDEVKKQTIKLYPYDMQFVAIEENQYKGRLRKHRLYQAGVDHDDVLQIAGEKASMGMRVDIMPNTNGNITWGKILFHDADDFAKSPDLRINDTLFEVEKATNASSFNNLKHAVDRAYQQAYNVIIRTSVRINKSEFFRLCVAGLRITKG